MKNVMLIITLFITISLFAQTETDNLIKKLKVADKREKVKILNELSYQLRRKNPKKSFDYAKESQKLSIAIKDKKNECEALKNIGNHYLLRGDYQKAYKNYSLALDIAEKKKFNQLQADLLYNLAFMEKNKHNYKEALNLYEKSLILYTKLDSKYKLANTLFSIGHIYWLKGQYKEVLKYQGKALKLYQELGSEKKIAQTYNNFGNVYYKMGDLNKSVAMYLKALEIREQLNDKSEIAKSLSNIGNIHIALGNNEKAMENYLKALEIYRNLNNIKLIVNMLNNIGVDYYKIGDMDNSLKYYKETLKYKDSQHTEIAVSFALNNIGKIMSAKKKYKEAQKYFEKSIEIKEKINDKTGLANSYRNLGYMYLKQKNSVKAKDMFIKSIKFARNIDDLEMLKESYGALAEIYLNMKNYKEAYDNLLQYKLLSDSLNSKDTNIKINELLIKYETEKKENEIKLLKHEGIIKELKLQKANIIRNISLIAFIFVVIIGFVYFKMKQRIISTQKVVENEITKLNKELEERVQNELKKQQQQQQLLIQKSKLESLGKLAAGIAHEINQPLGGISMGLENIYYSFENDEIDKKYFNSKLQAVKGYIKRISLIIDHIRIFSRDQKSIIIEKVDVNKVIKDALSMVQTQYKKHQIKIEQSLDENIGYVLGNRYKLEQVVLNLLSNAKDAVDEKKIAKNDITFQKEIIIKTYEDNAKIYLEIKDNGVGIDDKTLHNIFDPFFTTKDPEKGTGLGLSIIYGIINEIKGKITVESKLGKYTKMIVILSKIDRGQDE